jgi:hypothetical protein
MINIQFPQSPEKYNFVLANDFGSVYLVAKAAKHYGPNNINVICPFDEKYHFHQSVHAISELLGISNVRTVTLDSAIPSFPRYTVNNVENSKNTQAVSTPITRPNSVLLQDILLKFFQQFEPLYSSLEQVDAGLVTSMYGLAGQEMMLSVFRDANIIGESLTLNGTDPYQTVVMDVSQTRGVDTAYHTFYKRVYPNWTKLFVETQPEGPLWLPLSDYSLNDILVSANEENLMEPLLAIYHCAHKRPEHCGACYQCRERRMSLIEANIYDPTIYAQT